MAVPGLKMFSKLTDRAEAASDEADRGAGNNILFTIEHMFDIL